LTIAGGIAGASTGSLTKTGSGTVVVTGAVSLNSGSGTRVTVNDGTLQASFGTSGVGLINIGATGNLSLVNAATNILMLNGTAGALTLTSGAQLGFELAAPGTNDKLVIPSGGTAVESGMITLNLTSLGGFGAGTY